MDKKDKKTVNLLSKEVYHYEKKSQGFQIEKSAKNAAQILLKIAKKEKNYVIIIIFCLKKQKSGVQIEMNVLKYTIK